MTTTPNHFDLIARLQHQEAAVRLRVQLTAHLQQAAELFGETAIP